MIDTRSLEVVDPEIGDLVAAEATRQRIHVQLIALEIFVSRAVMEAVGSVFTNEYSEAYPGRRCYEGYVVVDEVESLAVERAKSLFGGLWGTKVP